MSENENVGIELGVDADAALTTFQELTAAALTADEAIQQLKQHQVELANAIPGNPQASSYTEVATRFQQMDPSLIRDTYPEIAQTQYALNARRTEVRAQAMDFVGANPQVAAQPLPDTLAQFQQAMAQREQQQQAQRERQAQQQAAGVIPPARYGSETAPVLAPPVATAGAAPQGLPTVGPSVSPTNTPPSLPTPTPTGVPVSVPLATTGDERLAQALTAHSQPPATATATATPDATTDAMPGATTGAAPQPMPIPVGVQPVAPLATTGDDRLAQALTTQNQPAATAPPATAAPADVAGPLPETFEELAAAARAADTQLQGLKQRLLDAFNAIPRGSQPEAASYGEAVGRLRQMDPSVVQELHPDITRTQGAINARRDELTGQVSHFAADNPEAAAEPLPAQQDMLTRWQDLLRQHNAQQQAATGPGQGGGDGQGGDDALPNAGGATYYRQSARSGPFVPPGMERLARFGYDATQQMDAHDARQRSGLPGINGGGNSGNGGGNGNDTTQQDRTATVLSEHIAQALTRGASGLVAGGIQGAANAAGLGATGDIVAGLARPLMGLMGEATLPLAAAAAVGGAALGVGDLQAKYTTDRQSLAGSIGTRSGATPGSELSTAMHAGWPFDFKEGESAAAARQLGLAGVDSSQLGGGLDASMALARHGGIGLDQATSTVGGLMQSGMSGNQVADYLATLDQAARQTGVSVTRLAEGVTHLNQAAGVGQISINGLAAAQALTDRTGTKIDIGQAMSGAIGATGTTALAQGALLGLNPAQFETATQNPAVLLDSYANLARRYDVGTGGVQVAQQAMSAAGFDFSKMDSHQADVFTRKLVAQGPRAAQAYEDSITKKEHAPGAPGPHTGADYIQAGKTIADAITGPTAKLGIVLDAGAAALGNAAGAINRAVARSDPRYGLNGTDTSAGPNPYHIQPTRPLQGDNTVPLAPLSPYDLGIHTIGSAPAPTPPGFVPNLPGLVAAQYQGLQVPNLAGSEQYASPAIVNDIVSAARADKLSPGPMLAQAAQESGFNPNNRAKDGGTGLFQFTDPAVSREYLGQASHELHRTMPSDWHQAALDPQVASRAAADYDKALLQGTHGNWAKAAAQFNAGPHGWDLTNKPGQGQMYGIGVAGNGETVQHQLAISVTVQDQNGNKVGQTKTQHNINTSKKVVAAQSYGPQDNSSPTVGLPLGLPARIK